MVVRNAIARLALVVVFGLFSAQAASAEECAKAANGAAMATGSGNSGRASDSKGMQRLKAERAAYLGGLSKLKACLGDKVKSIGGFSIAAVRYFDADPIVEVDVSASMDKTPTVTVIGSGLPVASAMGSNAKAQRISTTTAAKKIAQRNAKEALRTVFPTDGEQEGDLSSRLMGTLGACNTDEITYWDDLAVTVKLTCGKGPAGAADPAPSGQPAIGKH